MVDGYSLSRPASCSHLFNEPVTQAVDEEEEKEKTKKEIIVFVGSRHVEGMSSSRRMKSFTSPVEEKK